jgi:RNA polymerase sigma factor (sigma-70 family)
VGRTLTDVVETSRIVAEPSDDHRLIAAVRRGDDRAFEALYGRYHRRIHAYIVGMVKDHGRAEDITQEVFVSALRRMRDTERPIAFKPWIYEIAKNACIDQFRRSRRAEEISLEADEGLAPADYGKLVGSEPTPDAAVATKQDLDNLRGAFVGLSDTHHEILVMRELEGLSYREIGERLGMSRPAVESTLFRARRRLTEEYDELVSGARCRRIQSLIAIAGETRLGTRESRRLSRHVAHCQPCRREAMAAGLDSAIFTHVPLRKRAADKIGSLLPFGWFARLRGGDSGAMAPMLSDQLQGGWGKLATVAAVAIAGMGAAGVGTKVAEGGDEPPRRGDRPAAVERTGAAAKAGGAATTTRATPGPATRKATPRPSKRARQRDRAAAGGRAGDGGAGSGGGAGAGNAAGGAGQQSAGGSDPAAPVTETVRNVGKTVEPAVNGVTETVGGAGGTVENAAGGVGETVENAASGVGDTVEGATGGVGDAVGGPVGETVSGAGGTVGNTVNGVGGTVGNTVKGVGGTVGDTADGAGGAVGGLLP